ncbi:hypothetical protein C8P63_13221 [Melghirimyces profundicolus]|uniref:Uncharacterized protein n=1 Tax=Melghirimyces profundicolus TaxID=1242148 RepID=A0A2T6B7E2_9BACL|nr:hypothetical protein C8P63_13221 [Melghirimyces profundicolus]
MGEDREPIPADFHRTENHGEWWALWKNHIAGECGFGPETTARANGSIDGEIIKRMVGLNRKKTGEIRRSFFCQECFCRSLAPVRHFRMLSQG